MSVVKRSAVDTAERVDAQFFRKTYLSEDVALGRHEIDRIGAHAKVTDGPHGYHEVDEDSPIAMLTAKSAANWFATRKGADTISAVTHAANMRSALEADDVILGTRGTVGRCALVTREALPANIDQDVARITLASGACWIPEFLTAYLNCRFGQDHVERHSTGMVQQGISLAKVRDIPVPILKSSFQDRIKCVVLDAKEALDRQVTLFDEAQSVLLDALGLRNWLPSEPLTYARALSAVSTAGRLDPQYYQPAKIDMLTRLGAMPGAPLADSFDLIREVVDPRKNPAGRCRNYDLTDALQPVLDATTVPVTFADMDSHKVRMRDGDLAVSRLRSYLREIAVVRVEDDIPSVGSSEFYVLRRKPEAAELTAEALMIYLRSPPVQIILKWCQDGSQHPRFSERDLMAVPLPDAVVELNTALTDKVCDALANRAKSKRLLDATKRAVEIAIEQDEAAALRFISEQGEGADAGSA